jgi:uncharacterized protein YuzE
MLKLIETFPVLTRELSQSLRNEGRQTLAEQIDAALITRITFDEAANAGYIYVEPSRALNVIETNIVGVRHGETIPVKTQFWTNIDTDNFDRLVGVEILNPGALKSELSKRAID